MFFVTVAAKILNMVVNAAKKDRVIGYNIKMLTRNFDCLVTGYCVLLYIPLNNARNIFKYDYVCRRCDRYVYRCINRDKIDSIDIVEL